MTTNQIITLCVRYHVSIHELRKSVLKEVQTDFHRKTLANISKLIR